jgi:superoxide dismutase
MLRSEKLRFELDKVRISGLQSRQNRSHLHNAPMSRPLLALDMYEHVYQMDYGAAAAKYVDAFMRNVNWEEVNRCFVSARKMAVAV